MTDDEITARLLDHIGRDEREKQAFLEQLGDDYPEPRGNLEWGAYKRLRQWWSPSHVQQFIEAYQKDSLTYPGILDTPGRPSLSEFMTDVGLLAEGQYARTLTTPEMLELVAGRKAAHGAKFKSSPTRNDALNREIDAALMALPPTASTLEILHHIESRGDRTVIQEVDLELNEIRWVDARGEERETSWKSFQNRCSKRRKKF